MLSYIRIDQIGVEGIKAIGEGLKKNSKLQELNVCIIGLYYEIIDWNCIPSEGLRAFSKLIEGNTTLKKLEIGNSLDDVKIYRIQL